MQSLNCSEPIQKQRINSDLYKMNDAAAAADDDVDDNGEDVDDNDDDQEDVDDDFCLFDSFLYVLITIFQLNRNRSSWVEPVLS